MVTPMTLTAADQGLQAPMVLVSFSLVLVRMRMQVLVMFLSICPMVPSMVLV